MEGSVKKPHRHGYPDPDNPLLKATLDECLTVYLSGECTAEEAILHAIVTGWFEGHLEGVDCPGGDHRRHPEAEFN